MNVKWQRRRTVYQERHVSKSVKYKKQVSERYVLDNNLYSFRKICIGEYHLQWVSETWNIVLYILYTAYLSSKIIKNRNGNKEVTSIKITLWDSAVIKSSGFGIR